MCQSQAQGGKRCATHTRPAYSAAINHIQQLGLTPKLVSELYLATSAYATTQGAIKRISEYIALVEQGAINQDRNFGSKFGQKDRDIATILRNAIADSAQQMEALKETGAEREAQIQDLVTRALTVRSEMPKTETLDDAIELIQTALVLGMDVPAIVGSDLWMVTLKEHGAGMTSYMPTPSKEIALALLADWVTEITDGYNYIPNRNPEERDADLRQYRLEHTDAEIVKEFFDKQKLEDDYSYEISQLKVLGRDQTLTLPLTGKTPPTISMILTPNEYLPTEISRDGARVKPLHEGVRISYMSDQANHTCEATYIDGKHIGYIAWSRNTGRIQNISVLDPAMRRKGIATALWNYATNISIEQRWKLPKHSANRTDFGEPWARSFGVTLPMRREKS